MVRLGLRPWLWTIDPVTGSTGIESEAIVDGVHAIGAGDVVLLHDGIEGPLAPAAIDRQATGQALPASRRSPGSAVSGSSP